MQDFIFPPPLYFHHQWWNVQTTSKGMFQLPHNPLTTPRGGLEGPHHSVSTSIPDGPEPIKVKLPPHLKSWARGQAGSDPDRSCSPATEPNIWPASFLRVEGKGGFGFQALVLWPWTLEFSGLAYTVYIFAWTVSTWVDSNVNTPITIAHVFPCSTATSIYWKNICPAKYAK